MASKLSNARPRGSIFAWQEAHVAFVEWAASCSRIVAFGLSEGTGSSGSTFGGGGGGVRAKIASETQAPRCTGRCRVPSEVSERIPACVRIPPRWLSGFRLTRSSTDVSGIGKE